MYDYSYKDYNFTLEELKRNTIYIRRKKNVSFEEYNVILDLIYYPESTHKEFHDLFHPTNEESINFWKKFLTALDDFDTEIQDLSFLKEDEEYFYSTLPNDGDILLSAIYYFLLEPHKQKSTFSWLFFGLIREQLDILSVKQFKDDKDLLKTFHQLTDGRKKQVIDFVKFLYHEQGIREVRKQIRQERKIEDKLKRFKKEQ